MLETADQFITEAAARPIDGFVEERYGCDEW
jgi:hypothetical protein